MYFFTFVHLCRSQADVTEAVAAAAGGMLTLAVRGDDQIATYPSRKDKDKHVRASVARVVLSFANWHGSSGLL